MIKWCLCDTAAATASWASVDLDEHSWVHWLMIVFITWNSNLVPLLEGLCSSNPCRFEISGFLGFCRKRNDDLRIDRPALWPTELVLHRPGYAHPAASVWANVYAVVTTPWRTHLHMHGAQNTCLNACILSTKNVLATVHARLCNGAEPYLTWKLLQTYHESCASIVQAVGCRPPCYCLDEISRPTLFTQSLFIQCWGIMIGGFN